jgi:hypothetical protein
MNQALYAHTNKKKKKRLSKIVWPNQAFLPSRGNSVITGQGEEGEELELIHLLFPFKKKVVG